jgi:hypothetical protein
LPAAWDKPDAPRWEAARNLLDHDTYHANEPLLRQAAMGLLVEMKSEHKLESLLDDFST